MNPSTKMQSHNMLRTLQATIQAEREREEKKKRDRDEAQLQRKQQRIEYPSQQRYTNVPTPQPSFSRLDFVTLMHVGNLSGLAKADIIQLFRYKLDIVHIIVKYIHFHYAFVIILKRDAKERVVLFKGREITISVARNQQIRHSQLVIMQNGEEVCAFHANGSCEHDHHLRSGRNCLFGRHSPPVRSQKRNVQQQQPITAAVQDTRIRELLEKKDGRDRVSVLPIHKKRVGPGMKSITQAAAAAAVSSSSSEEDEEVSPPQEASPASRVSLPRGRKGGPTAFQVFDQQVASRLANSNIPCPAFPINNRNVLESDHDEEDSNEEDSNEEDSDEEDSDEEDVVRRYDDAMASRLSARGHLASWKQSLNGKGCDLSDEEIVWFLSGECFLCGRKHVEGVNPCNTIDRLYSSIGLYHAGLCCTLCGECNSLKLWLQPAEFLEIICLWYQRREHIINYFPGIRNLEHLEQLASEEPDGTLARIPNEALSHTRKGRDPLLRNATIQPIILDLVTCPCSFCGKPSGFGLDRPDSDESYNSSMRHGRLLPCCSHCNVIWLNRDREVLFVHVIRIYNHVSQLDPDTLDDFHRRVYNIFCDTSELDNTLTWMHSNQRPVETTVGGQRIMAPSIRVLRDYRFGRGVTDEGSLRVTNVSIAQYKAWLWSQDAVSLSQLRSALGVTRDLNDRIEISEEQDDLLLELDASAEEADANITRPSRVRSSGWRNAISARIDEMGSDSDSEDSDSEDEDSEDEDSEDESENRGSNSEDDKESTSKSGSGSNYLDLDEIGSVNSGLDSDYKESNSVGSDDDDCSLDSFFDDGPDPEARYINASKDTSIKHLVLDPRGRGDRVPGQKHYYCKVTTCKSIAQGYAKFHSMCRHHRTLFRAQDPDNKRGWKVKEKDTSIKHLVLDPRGRGDMMPGVVHRTYYCKVTTCRSARRSKCHRMCVHHNNLFQAQDPNNKRKWKVNGH